MTNVNWIPVTEMLPKNRQRIIYYKPDRLSKVGEMIYLDTDNDKRNFLEEVTHWAPNMNKPL